MLGHQPYRQPVCYAVPSGRGKLSDRLAAALPETAHSAGLVGASTFESALALASKTDSNADINKLSRRVRSADGAT